MKICVQVYEIRCRNLEEGRWRKLGLRSTLRGLCRESVNVKSIFFFGVQQEKEEHLQGVFGLENFHSY